jgi:hypothetical protein
VLAAVSVAVAAPDSVIAGNRLNIAHRTLILGGDDRDGWRRPATSFHNAHRTNMLASYEPNRGKQRRSAALRWSHEFMQGEIPPGPPLSLTQRPHRNAQVQERFAWHAGGSGGQSADET